MRVCHSPYIYAPLRLWHSMHVLAAAVIGCVSMLGSCLLWMWVVWAFLSERGLGPQRLLRVALEAPLLGEEGEEGEEGDDRQIA